MNVGIDASNLRAGGGLTHLDSLLRFGDPISTGIDRIVVWGGRMALERLASKPWLELRHERALDGSALQREWWRRVLLNRRMRDVDVLFAPGGLYNGSHMPVVTMSRNLLPFEPTERARFGFSLTRLRYHLLEYGQARAFREASGVIFLTPRGQKLVESRTGSLPGRTVVIPHGLAPRFVSPPRTSNSLSAYSNDRPFRWLYVSIINHYKHQWNVAEAVSRLREEGLPVALDLVGPANRKAQKRLKQTLTRVDPEGKVVRYHGAVPHHEIDRIYRQADAFVFASSCETFGQVVLEAMAAGLPVASSNRSAIPDVVGPAGHYFDPENVDDISRALREMSQDATLRERLAASAFERAQTFSWERCAHDTFQFIASVARNYHQQKRGV